MKQKTALELKGQEDWLMGLISPNSERKLSITITLKQGRQRSDGTWQRIDHNEAKKLIKEFYKATNKMAFKNAYKRHGKRVFLLTALEGLRDKKRLHAHLSLGIPPRFTVEDFIKWVDTTLRQYSWVHKQVDIQHLNTKSAEISWHRYLCKENVELDLFEPEPYKHD